MPILDQIQFISQWGAGADKFRNDCGPTVVAMLLQAYGKLGSNTPDTLFSKIQASDNYTNRSQLIALLASFGVSAAPRNGMDIEHVRALIDQRIPIVAVINYATLVNAGVPVEMRFFGAHILLIVGYDDDHVYVLDPLRKEQGLVKILTVIFMAAWTDAKKQGNFARGGIIPPALPNPVYYMLLAFGDRAVLTTELHKFVIKENVISEDIPALAGVGALMRLDTKEARALFAAVSNTFSEYQALHTQPASEMLIITNQAMINFFFAAFGAAAWSKIEKCNLAYMAQDKLTRQATYTGPNVVDMPMEKIDRDKLTEAINKGIG